MPPRTLNRNPRPAKQRGSDPTVTIAAASTAKVAMSEGKKEENQNDGQQKTNDDLKKLIETLKNKIGSPQNTPPQKKAPPKPEARTIWKRTVKNEWTSKPAYTILTRVSNHEKVPVKSTQQSEITIDCLPHSFLYKPGIDGIKIDKLDIKAGKQISMG